MGFEPLTVGLETTMCMPAVADVLVVDVLRKDGVRHLDLPAMPQDLQTRLHTKQLPMAAE